MTSGPIFVAGAERSGTSLMYALLASHRNISMTRRTNFFRYFWGQYGDLANPADRDRCIGMLARYKRIAIHNVDFDQLRVDFAAGPQTYGRLYQVLQEQLAEREHKPRWGDKSLDTEQYADRVFAAYTDAHIIHVLRDPRDRWASVITRWEQRRGGVGASTAEWRASADLADTNIAMYGTRYTVVRYEDLAADPEITMRSVCAAINEPFDEEMMALGGDSGFRDAGANSSYGQRQPGAITTASVGKYHDVLSHNDVAFIERFAGDAMALHGYAADGPRLSAASRLRFAAIDGPFNTATYVGWRLRSGFRKRNGQRLPEYRIVDPRSPS